MQSSQKQRQQQSLRQKSLLATRGIVLEQPLGDFSSLMDRFASESTFAEKRARPMTADGEDWSGNMDFLAAEEQPSATEYLMEQLNEEKKLSGQEEAICRRMVLDLDEAGFFRESPPAYAKKLNVSVGMVRRLLKVLQSLEPAGVGASDAAQALALQTARVLPGVSVSECTRCLRARRRSLSPSVLRAYIRKEHIPCTPEEWQQIEQLLDPAPLQRVAPSETHIVAPDIVIRADPLTHELTCAVAVPPWKLEVDAGTVTALRSQKTTKQQLEQELSHILWINQAIDERTILLTRLGNALIASLGPFLKGTTDGPSRMTADQLAEQTGMSRTTMTRALQRKFISTPRGTFRLRRFVMNRWESRSAPAKQMVLESLRQEGGEGLSDRAIAEQLTSKGIRISRRTVAKYRLSLGIPARYFRSS